MSPKKSPVNIEQSQYTDKISKLDKKIEKLKPFKTIINSSVSHECKFCFKVVETTKFMEHLKNCTPTYSPKLITFE